jgi:Nif-specific regulatory protein
MEQKLTQEPQSRNKELAAILEVSKVLTSSIDLEKNLTSAMITLGSLLDMQRGCVFLLDHESKQLKIVAAHGLTKEEIMRGKYRIGEGIVGRVITSGLPMIVPNIGDEPLFLNKTGSRPNKDGISFISIPIKLKGEIFGVISVDRIYSGEHGSVDDDLRVLQIVSSLIAQYVKLWESYKKVEKEKDQLKSQLKERFSFPNIIGESEKFQLILKSVVKVAGTDATVLLLGESGTGKELIARTLHYESKKAKGPLISVNCAALPSNLLEVELFGCEKGAFTGAVSRRIGRFELALGGTIFLDEIGELSYDLQAKLLRVLQEHSFERVGSGVPIKADVRVIAATNKNLLMEVKEGRFREGLYWRLNVVPILLPPLRERVDDIALLTDFYLRKFNKEYSKQLAFSEDALKVFISYPWTGNVRELANTIERLVIMADGEIIDRDNLPFCMFSFKLDKLDSKQFNQGDASLSDEVEEIERQRIIKALKDQNYVQIKTAKALGITQRQLGYRIKKYGVDIK